MLVMLLVRVRGRDVVMCAMGSLSDGIGGHWCSRQWACGPFTLSDRCRACCSYLKGAARRRPLWLLPRCGQLRRQPDSPTAGRQMSASARHDPNAVLLPFGLT